MTINSSNMFQALDLARQYELQAMMTIISARSGGLGATHNDGGVNPADESESTDGAAPTNGVSPTSDAGPSSTEINNTVQAYGLIAQIAMLVAEDASHSNTSVQTQITNDLTQLNKLTSLMDPTCLQNAQAVLTMFNYPSAPTSWTTSETNFTTFWGNTTTIPNNQPVPGTVYNPLSDLFYFLGSNNITSLTSLDSDAGFGMMMVFLSVNGSKMDALGLGRVVSDYLSQNNGLSCAQEVENFVFDYGIANGITSTELFNMLPLPQDTTDNYGLLYANMKAAYTGWATQPGMPNSNDPNYQQEMQSLAEGDWTFVAPFRIPTN